MFLSTNVAAVPAVKLLYFEVNVVLPAFNPVTQNTAEFLGKSPAFLVEDTKASASFAEIVVAPDTANDIYASTPDDEVMACAVKITIAVPEAPIVTVADGPTVAKSVYVADVVD